MATAATKSAVKVASCDNILDNCYSNQNGPTPWTYTLTAGNLSTLASAIAAGSLDFTYTWDNNTQFAIPGDDQYVYAGDPTLALTVSPEPATMVLCLGGSLGRHRPSPLAQSLNVRSQNQLKGDSDHEG